ncbi:MAG: hypothetical protein GX363_07185 [Clostridiales bacterium]|nr:hypothetical protein [Clostridiales bacterium]
MKTVNLVTHHITKVETNIFTRLHSAPDTAIIDQIALHESINMKNSLLQSFGKIQKEGVKAINWIARKLNQKDVMGEPDVVEIFELMDTKAKELANLPRQQLDLKLHRVLAERLNQSAHISSAKLSKILIEEAAEGLKIDAELTLGQKAHAIAARMEENLCKQIQKELKRMNSSQQEEYDRKLDLAIEELPVEEREKIAEALGVEAITGSSVRKMLAGASGPVALMLMVNMSGFGAYLMITTVAHAIFTTMLGITLPFAFYQNATLALSVLAGPLGIFLAAGIGGIPLVLGSRRLKRTLYAQTVWLGVRSSTIPIRADDELLPSYGRLNKNEVSQNLNKQFEALEHVTAELDTYRRRLREKEKEQSNVAKQLRLSRDTIAQIAQAKQDLEIKIKELNIKLVAQQDYVFNLEKQEEFQTSIEILKEELHNKNTEIEAYEQLLEEQEAQLYKFQSKHTNSSEKIQALEQHNKQLLQEKSKLEERYKIALDKEQGRIKESWEVHFPRLRFTSRALRFVARLSFTEQLELERTLVELQNAEDPNTLSRGKMRGLGNVQHGGCRIGPRRHIRYNFELKDGLVHILDIHDKKDQHKL